MQIDSRVALFRRGEEFVRFGKSFFEDADYFGADFVTARAGSGPNRRDDVFGTRTEFVLKLFYSVLYYRSGCAAPAGMDGGEGAGDRIGDQDGNAIGRLDGEQDLRSVTDQSIAVIVVAQHAGFWARLICGMDDAHIDAVNLPAAGQQPGAVEQLEKAPPVLVNILRVVFIETGKIERAFRHWADAAEPGRKRVRETARFERRTNQGPHAVAFAPIKSG